MDQQSKEMRWVPTAKMDCGLNTACKELITHAIESTLEKDRLARSIEEILRSKHDREESRTARIDELEIIPTGSLTGNQKKIIEAYSELAQYIVSAAYKPPYKCITVCTYIRLTDELEKFNRYGSEYLVPNVTFDYGSEDVTLHIKGFDPISISYAEAEDKRYIEMGKSDAECLATSAFLAIQSGNYEPFYDQLVVFISKLFPFKPGEVNLSGYDQIVNLCNDILRCGDPRIMKRHILLAGPLGCGKSMIAKRVVYENPEYVPFYLNMGGDSVRWFGFFSKIIHKCNRKMLLIIDEIDELGFSRDEEHSPVYELLRLMDGVEDLRGLTILATTNRPQVIDEALLRPGRFGPAIIVDAPNVEQAREIIRYYNVKFGSKADPIKVGEALYPIPPGAYIRMAMEDCIIRGEAITTENVIRNLRVTQQGA